MSSPTQIRLNLGGEGEEPGVINQQPDWVIRDAHWASVRTQLVPLISAGEPFLFCRNLEVPFPDDTVDYVFSNSVPVDVNTWLGPGVQSSEIRRILKSGGQWKHDGAVVYTKP